jgi:hypothetical protein
LDFPIRDFKEIDANNLEFCSTLWVRGGDPIGQRPFKAAAHLLILNDPLPEQMAAFAKEYRSHEAYPRIVESIFEHRPGIKFYSDIFYKACSKITKATPRNNKRPKKQKRYQRKRKGTKKKKMQVAKTIASNPRVQKAVGNLVKRELKKTPLYRHPAATLGRTIKKITGHGDYTITEGNALVHGAMESGVPGFHPKRHGTTVRHREYIGDVVASSVAGQFAITSYPINPGSGSVFPWLTPIANQYDQWRPNGIMVEFISTSSTYSGTSALGVVSIAADYDVYDTTYMNKVEMNNSEFAVSASAAKNIRYGLECAKSERPFNLLSVRGIGSLPTGASKNTYDLCNLQVATYGCTAGQVCGELWITYDITFFKEQMFGGILGKGVLWASAQLIGADNTHPFGTGTISTTGNRFAWGSNLSDITFGA